MQEQDRQDHDNAESTASAGGSRWLDGVIAGFMSEELTGDGDEAEDASRAPASGDRHRAWIDEGRARIDDTVASLLAPIIRKAMKEGPDDVAARLERIESRLEAIERLLADR